MYNHVLFVIGDIYDIQQTLQCNGIIVNVIVSCEVDRGFDYRLGQIMGYEIIICSFSAKHATVMCKSKDGLAQYQENVSKWSDMSTRGL